MKKALCLLLVFSFLLFTFTACKSNDSDDGDVLSGSEVSNDNSVAADTETVWLLSAEYRDGKQFSAYTFNEKGLISEMVSFSDGVAEGKFIYEYDEKGNEIKNNYLDKDGNTVIENTSTYDEKGNLTEKITKNSSSEEKLTYRYDSQGNMLEFIRESNGNIVEKEAYEYNDKGQCTDMKYFYGADGPATETKYTYDEKGNVIVEARIYEGEEKSKHEYSYNTNGKLIEELSYENGEIISSVEYSYDERGNQTQWVSYFSGEQDNCVQYEYSDDGLMVGETSFNADGTVRFEVVYEYDENGNKVKVTTNHVASDEVSVSAYEYVKAEVASVYLDAVYLQQQESNKL